MVRLATILTFLFMLLAAPFDWSDYYLTSASLVLKALFLGFILFLAIFKRNSLLFDRQFTFVLFVQIMALGVLVFFDGLVVHQNTILSLFIVFLVSALIESDLIDLKLFIKLFFFSMMFICSAVLISVFLAYNGMLTLRELDSDTYSIGLTLTKDLIFTDGGKIIFRPGGTFTEPGMLSLFLVFSLYLNRITFKNTLLDVLFIITGFISLSFFFMLYIIFYFLFTYSLKYSLAIILMLFSLFYLLSPFLDSNILYRVTGRFLQGDNFVIYNNRAPLIDWALNNVEMIRLFGSANSKIPSGIDVDATWLGFFFRFGWVSGILLFLHNFLIFPKTKITTESIAIFFVILIFFYQRPFIISFSYYIFIMLIRLRFRKSNFYI